MIARLIESLFARVCRALGHRDDVHDTGLVAVHVCPYCHSVRVRNYAARAGVVYLYYDPRHLDARGRPTRAPRAVLVVEDSPR